MAKKTIFWGIVLAFGFVLTGCITETVSLVKETDPKKMPVEDQCWLLVSTGSQPITGFDNKSVRWLSTSWRLFSWAERPAINTRKVVAIPPGKHTLYSKYFMVSGSFTMEIEYDFLPGHYYAATIQYTGYDSQKVFYKVTEDTTKLVVTDITETASTPDGEFLAKTLTNAKKKAGVQPPPDTAKPAAASQPSAASKTAASQPAAAFTGQYFAAINGRSGGPYSFDELRQLAREGKLTRDSLVWKEGMAQWAKAGSVAEFASVFSAVPPPLPPAGQSSSTPPPLPK